MNVEYERIIIRKKTMLCFHLYKLTPLPPELVYLIIIFLQEECRKKRREWLNSFSYKCIKDIKQRVCKAHSDKINAPIFNTNGLWLRYKFRSIGMDLEVCYKTEVKGYERHVDLNIKEHKDKKEIV